MHYGRENAALMQGFIHDCMKHLNMLPEPGPHPQSLPLMRMATHYAETGGAYKTLVSFGEKVRQGQTLGYIMDLVGNIDRRFARAKRVLSQSCEPAYVSIQEKQ